MEGGDSISLSGGLYTLAIGWAVFLVFSGPGRSQLKALISKLPLGLSVVSHLFLSADKSGLKKKGVDSDVISNGPFVATKRVIFIRHGESDWNEIFNRGFGPMFPVRVIIGLVRELFKLPSYDSLFVDSPLSSLGARQAVELQKLLASSPADLETKELISILRGESGSSLLVTSNLRRAIATAVIGLADRLRVGREKMYVVSSLQEISKNPDALALAKPKKLPDLNALDDQMLKQGFSAYTALDAEFNKGNKPLFNKGKDRLGAFAEFALGRNEDTIIATGHSLWFKHFFDTYIPQQAPHDARTKKITNCGVVAFTLAKGIRNDKPVYRIDPSSIRVVTGKFI